MAPGFNSSGSDDFAQFDFAGDTFVPLVLALDTVARLAVFVRLISDNFVVTRRRRTRLLAESEFYRLADAELVM